MKLVHQLVHTLSYGDAISGEVLALQRCFNDLGLDSEIYSINLHPKLKGKAKSYKEFPVDFCGETILHYSLGSPLNDLYKNLTSSKRTLIYHNLTPSSWFLSVNPRIVEDIEVGAKELPDLCRLSSRLLADSNFNASELDRLGFQADVLELPIDPQRWEEASNPGIANLVKNSPGTHLLHVGRLAPNKCIEDIIKTFYFLHHFIDKNSTLWLVGIDIDTEVYSFSLKRLVHELGLDQAVNFAGCMADSEVKALYENCSAYICMSEHEGFCVPLIEAMNFGLPILAYAASAVPDTLGDAGVLVHEKKHPEMAELIYEISVNLELRSKLIAAGKQRIETLSYEAFSKKVKQIFLKDPVVAASGA